MSHVIDTRTSGREVNCMMTRMCVCVCVYIYTYTISQLFSPTVEANPVLRQQHLLNANSCLVTSKAVVLFLSLTINQANLDF